MKRKYFLLYAAATIMLFSTASFARNNDTEDTETRLVNARVVEATATRISVIAQTGVEHVIAIGEGRTEVTIDGEKVKLKDVREDDVITVELDPRDEMKFAKNIQIANTDGTQLARIRR